MIIIFNPPAKKLFAIALLAGFASSSPLLAQSPSRTEFTVINLDGNGQISHQEASKEGISEPVFRRADLDRSGFLTFDEHQRINSIG